MRRLGWLAAYAAPAAALAPIASAAAAGPFVLDRSGQARNPSVAIDARGAAHLVWSRGPDSTGGRPDALVYCKLARGARSCAPLAVLPAPGTDNEGRPQVRVLADGRILVLVQRCCVELPGQFQSTYRLISADGGATFSPAAAIGVVAPESAAADPGGAAVTLASGFAGSQGVQAVPLEPAIGPPPAEAATLIGFDPRVAYLGPGTPIVVAGDPATTLRPKALLWRLAGPPNQASSWRRTSLGLGAEPELATGPRGTHLLVRVLRGPRAYRYVARRWAGNRFGRPVPVSETAQHEDATGVSGGQLVEDRSGRLHAIWVSGDQSGQRRQVLRRRTSRNGSGGPRRSRSGSAGSSACGPRPPPAAGGWRSGTATAAGRCGRSGSAPATAARASAERAGQRPGRAARAEASWARERRSSLR